MKFIKFSIFLIMFSFVTMNAQEFRFKTTQLSVLEKNNKNKWGSWSKPEKTEMVVTLDYSTNKIVIYSREIQHYRVVEYLQKESSKDDEINSYLCKNQENTPAKISFFVRRNLKNKTQMYVYYKDIIFCYDIIEIQN